MMISRSHLYVKKYHRQSKWMQFLTKNDGLLVKLNTTWDKFSVDIEKEFDSKPVSNKNLETKVKP